MAVRRERVILSLQDDYSGGVLRAATATKALKAAINDLDGEYVGAGRGVQTFSKSLEKNNAELRHEQRELGNAGALVRALAADLDRGTGALRRNSSEFDSHSGRLRLWAKAIATIGPGLVPLGGAGIAGAVGLSNQAGVAALAGTSAVIAFQGVGDALDKLNKAAIEPTAANLENARLALDQIGPSAQALVSHLFALREEWAELRSAAADGIMPGVDAALTSLETRFPDFERILRTINGETGRLLASGADNLASGEWDEFFVFLRTDAVDTLSDLGRTIGNVARGVTELVMAFDPLNDDFSGWLLKASRDFAVWADGLGETQSFQDFVEYIRATGPQVSATLGAIAGALIDIVQAAAPLGGPVLEVLESLFKTISAIADSDFGTPLITGLAAISLLSTGLKGFDRVMGASFGLRGKNSVKETVAGWKAAVPTLNEAGTTFYRLGQSAENASEKTLKARQSVRGFAREIGPAAAGAAGIGLIATGTTEKLGLTNTATLALAGSLAGPWGAAVGGAIGLVTDLNATIGISATELERYGQKIQALGGPTIAGQIASVTKELEKQREIAGDGTENFFGKTLFGIPDLLSHDAQDDAVKSAKELETRLESLLAQEDLNRIAAVGMAGGSSAAADQFFRAAAATEEFESALKELNDLLSNRASLRDYEAALDEFRKGLKGKNNGLSFDIDTEKGRQNLENLDAIADRALRRAQQLKEQGKELAAQRILQRARQDIKDFLPDTEEAREAAKDVLRELRELARTKAKPEIDVENEQALGSINAVENALGRVNDKTVFLNVVRRKAAGFGADVVVAGGGTIPGARFPYRDSVLAYLAPTEEVITNKNGEADRFRADRAAGRIPAYAAGGTVLPARGGRPDRGASLQGVIEEFVSLKDATKSLGRAAKDAASALDKERQKRDELRSDRDALSSAVAGKFNNDLFSPTSNPFAPGAGDFMSVLQGDIADLQDLNKARVQLTRKGLDGDALAAVLEQGDLADVQQLAGLSRGALSELKKDFERRAALQAAVGSAAGNAAYGPEFRAMRRDLADARDELRKANRQREAGNRQREAGNRQRARVAKDTGQEVGKAVNGGASRGRRNQPRG